MSTIDRIRSMRERLSHKLTTTFLGLTVASSFSPLAAQKSSNVLGEGETKMVKTEVHFDTQTQTTSLGTPLKELATNPENLWELDKMPSQEKNWVINHIDAAELLPSYYYSINKEAVEELFAKGLNIIDKNNDKVRCYSDTYPNYLVDEETARLSNGVELKAYKVVDGSVSWGATFADSPVGECLPYIDITDSNWQKEGMASDKLIGNDNAEKSETTALRIRRLPNGEYKILPLGYERKHLGVDTTSFKEYFGELQKEVDFVNRVVKNTLKEVENFEKSNTNNNSKLLVQKYAREY